LTQAKRQVPINCIHTQPDSGSAFPLRFFF